MYTPRTNDPTFWVFQDGKAAFTGSFTDTGAIRNFSEPETLIARYGDPRPALRDRPEVAPGRDIKALISSPEGLSFFRFRLDVQKGEIAGLMNAAGNDPAGNPWGIEAPENLDSLTAIREQMDFVACGDIDALRRGYGGAVGKPSDQTGNTELVKLRKSAAAALAARDKAVREAADAKDVAAKAGLEREAARKIVADALGEVQAHANGMRREAGEKGGGKFAIALRSHAAALDKLVTAYRQKAGL